MVLDEAGEKMGGKNAYVAQAGYIIRVSEYSFLCIAP